jgi:hypothetical protein
LRTAATLPVVLSWRMIRLGAALRLCRYCHTYCTAKSARPRMLCLLIDREVITTSGIVIHNVVAALKRL